MWSRDDESYQLYECDKDIWTRENCREKQEDLQKMKRMQNTIKEEVTMQYFSKDRDKNKAINLETITHLNV